MTPTTQSLPNLQPRNLTAMWFVVLAVTIVYCELHEVAYGRPPVGLDVSILWALKVWAGWIVLSAALICGKGRIGLLLRLWERPFGPLALVFASAVAFLSEWMLHTAFWAIGWIDWQNPAWVLLHERAPLYLVISISLVAASSYLRRRAAVQPVRQHQSMQPGRHITVTTSRGPLAIAWSDVEAIVAAENYVEICMVGGKQYLHRATLQGIGATLDPAEFVRVHRSVIVNLAHLRGRLPGGRLLLASGRVVSVGRGYRAGFAQKLAERERSQPR